MKLRVKVSPNDKKEKVEKTASGLQVYVREPAKEGKANKRLVEVLAKYLGVKKYQITILSGKRSKYKMVEVDGFS